MESTFLCVPLFEWVGYFSMALVLTSFLMKKLRTLRIVNTIGCALFVVYGLILPEPSWPIVITNLAIIAINAVYLLRTKKVTE